jgi:predicted dehydrogenase
MNKTRIAVVGAGQIGQVHMGVAQKSATCLLSAVVDPSPSAMALAAQAGVPHYPSIDALLASDRPDGLILATPNSLHLSQALQCIEAGMPILLEKPVTTSVVDGEQLIRAVDAAGAKVLVGHHRAHSSLMAKAKELVDSGRLGKLVAVMGSAMFFKPDSYFADAPWRREAGAGPILINMIHEVHNLRLLCGDIVAVQAFASHHARGFPVEDTVAINLRFASGALGTFMLSDTAASARSWEQTSQENKAYASYDDEDCYVISGTFGSLSVPTMRLKIYGRAEDRSWWKPFDVSVAGVTRSDPLALQLEHFGTVIRGEAPPLVTVRDGVANLRATEAIALAAKTGQLIELPAPSFF